MNSSRMFATNWLYFKILPDSLNETTMKQEMTSISDDIIVCLFQITRICGKKGLTLKVNAKQGVFFKDLLQPSTL